MKPGMYQPHTLKYYTGYIASFTHELDVLGITVISTVILIMIDIHHTSKVRGT